MSARRWRAAVSQERLFVAQAAQVSEAQWFAPDADFGHPSEDDELRPIRVERHHYIEIFVFPAADEEDAYRQALQWAENESDVNYDPPSDRNVWYALCGTSDGPQFLPTCDVAQVAAPSSPSKGKPWEPNPLDRKTILGN